MSNKQEITGYKPSDLSAVLYGGGEMMKPFARNIRLWTGYLRGCQYRKNILKHVAKLKVGDRLQILREPKNQYDGMAITVRDQKNHDLGYIPREHNEILANLMDAGKCIYGEICELTYYEDPDDDDYAPWEMIKIDLFMED